jgi:Secretion system C-terminal sorting domain/Protein of unknown function (DUF1501)
LNLLNIDNRVIGLTYSEFGRRIRSNAALGTDHGTAAPVFLFGSCINNQILGDHPEIDTQVGIDDGVAMQYDFRDIYGTLLHNWLGVSREDVTQLLHPDFQLLPIIKQACIVTTGTSENFGSVVDFEVYPNPTADYIHLRFTNDIDAAIINIFDSSGGLVLNKALKGVTDPYHSISVDLNGLVAGTYFVHLRSKRLNKTKRILKI